MCLALKNNFSENFDSVYDKVSFQKSWKRSSALIYQKLSSPLYNHSFSLRVVGLKI